MFKVGDVIPAVPMTVSEGKQCEHVRKAKVVYIHPEGRFYTLEFTFHSGSFRESRLFTEEEREEGRREGLFRRTKRVERHNMACPPGFITTGFDGDEDVFIGGYGEARKKNNSPYDELDAAMY